MLVLTDIGVESSPERDDRSVVSSASLASRLRRLMPLGVRTDAVELLDSGSLSPSEVEKNLADLARLNRLPGGTAASVEAVRRLAGDMDGLEILDAGTGRADMPIAFVRQGWRATALDLNPDVLRVARRETEDEPGVRITEGDVRSLPFTDDAFDVAHASLLTHHLDPDDVVIALCELARVARHGVVVNDLRRGILPMAASWVAIAALGRTPVTMRDGMVSTRRAYTVPELDALLARAGLTVRWRSAAWLPRVVTAASRA